MLKPILFQTDAEHAHEIALSAAGSVNNSGFLQSLTRTLFHESDEGLAREFFGLRFPNPIGLAAGFDKNGSTPLAMQALGFGFVEVGSVTARPSLGNPKPRAFRLPADDSLINRMGLNNEGAKTISRRLAGLNTDIPLGVNIAKTNDASVHGDEALADYLYSYEKVLPHADYITVNISCPNTGEGKTFEDPSALRDLLQTLEPGKEGRKPTLVKFSVDTDNDTLADLVGICEDYDISGYVATNTSSIRNGLKTSQQRLNQIGNGGLSGKAIFSESNRVIARLDEILNKSKPIIGVGGVNSVETALEKMEAGADLIQIYTGLVFEGPGLVARIKHGLKKQSD